MNKIPSSITSKTNLESVNEKEVLLTILANQMHLVRRLDYLEQNLFKKINPDHNWEIPHYDDTFMDMYQKIDTYLKRLDEYMDWENKKP